MNKFFVPQEDIEFNTAYIRGEDVKHIRKVLRLECGDNININNCNGKEFLGEIKEIDKDKVIVNIIEELKDYNESKIKIYLFQGLPKASKMDLIVQKAVELGVYEITPVVTSRVVVRNDSGEFKKVDRWNKIAKEACKQCKRSIIPKVNVPISFKELLSEGECMDLIVVPYENESNAGVKKLVNSIEDKNNLEKVAIVIGPEGGFEEQEIDELKNINSHIVTLGPRILRTETAGFVCISLIMYELGDLGGLY